MRPRTVLVPTKARDGTVRGALVLDLDHRALAGLIRALEPLRDHPVEPGALEPIEPVGGELAVQRGGREVDRRIELPGQLALEHRAPLTLGGHAEVPVAEGKEVP